MYTFGTEINNNIEIIVRNDDFYFPCYECNEKSLYLYYSDNIDINLCCEIHKPLDEEDIYLICNSPKVGYCNLIE